MSRFLHLMVSLVLLFYAGTSCCLANENDGYYLYTSTDIKNVRESSKTAWGRQMLDDFERIVNQRLQHPLELPLLEGGHIHHYYCPIHNTQLVFDWNSPRAHYCIPCDKKWSGVDKFDWAWVHMVHGQNQSFLNACNYLYQATGDNKYAEHIKNMLIDLADKYPDYKVHDRERKLDCKYGGKLFAQSLDEAVWAIDACKAYSAIESTLSVDEKQKIKEGFFSPCAELMLRQTATNNWQVWHNAAIVTLGVVLKNDKIIDVGLNKKDFGYHDMFEKNVYSDGWWNEGSVGYHFYPLRAMILSAEAVRCRGINLYNPRLVAMFTAPINLIYADLTFPSQNDVSYGMKLSDHVSLYEIIAARTNDPQFTSLLKLFYKSVKRNSSEALISGINLNGNVKPLNLKSHLFASMGVGVLRSGDRTVVIKSGPHGDVHGHPDKLSISIHDGKSEILPDLGVTAYGVPDCERWYQKSFAHNTVVVDHANQLKCDAVIKSFVPTDNGARVEAEANSAYKGVAMSRTLELDKKTLKDNFRCVSEGEHTYDYVMILMKPIDFGGHADSSIIRSYERINDVRSKSLNKSFSFRCQSAQVTINVDSQDGFEVISGTSPGIPPQGTTIGGEAYPLIIRTKAKNMSIQTIWDFD